MILFARKLNNSIKSGGVAVCSQLKPRLNNFCGKGKKIFFSAGSKLPCLYFWSAAISVFFKKELYRAPDLLYVCKLFVNLLELWCLCWIRLWLPLLVMNSCSFSLYLCTWGVHQSRAIMNYSSQSSELVMLKREDSAALPCLFLPLQAA